MSKSAFLRGVGSVINLFPTERAPIKFSYLSSRILSDEEAFREDLEQVGADMFCAIKIIDKSSGVSNP